LANAERVVARYAELQRSNAVSRQAYDDAVAARDQAAARLASARARFELVVAGPRAETVEEARARKAAAEARLAAARRALDDAALLAPASGIVLSRVREPGSVVAA